MNKIRIGVLGNAGIANKRFLPALQKCDLFEFKGIAVEKHDEKFREKISKAITVAENYGGTVYEGYEALLKSSNIDSVYIPLPPALHFKWTKLALEYGKNVYLEKPFTTSLDDTNELIQIADSKNLALYENYAFVFHKEISAIKELLNQNKIGNIQLIRASFGFPYRGDNDFRYFKDMGGGALLDCGGYTIKAALEFLDDNVSVNFSKLYDRIDHDVDINGSVVLEDKNGIVAQLAFGMDSSYKCDFEIWGNVGYLRIDRFFTPPADYGIQIHYSDSKSVSVIEVGEDDQFLHALEHFYKLVEDSSLRKKEYSKILKQATIVQQTYRMGR